jgi:hypothetical protein
LLDGALDLDTVLRALDAGSLFSYDDRLHYHTLGGLAMLALGRVPRTGMCSTAVTSASRSLTWMAIGSTGCSQAAYLAESEVLERSTVLQEDR